MSDIQVVDATYQTGTLTSPALPQGSDCDSTRETHYRGNEQAPRPGESRGFPVVGSPAIINRRERKTDNHEPDRKDNTLTQRKNDRGTQTSQVATRTSAKPRGGRCRTLSPNRQLAPLAPPTTASNVGFTSARFRHMKLPVKDYDALGVAIVFRMPDHSAAPAGLKASILKILIQTISP